jgi:catechol 2,3-dioxygenase-like lactoylglutathione lyase family enzyme
MITGGNATIFVADMDRAVEFYTGTLGLTLVFRAGNEWAEVRAGDSLVIGLHPATEHGPAPGTSGAIRVGLSVESSIDEVVAALQAKGVTFRGPIFRDPKGGLAFADFGDPDGNSLYLWQMTGS